MFQLRILRKRDVLSHLFYQRRFVFKQKWAKHNREKEQKQLALEHFDHYHRQTFDEQWPSIRLGLLSQQKYSAILNNYHEHCKQISQDLIGEGSYDILQLAIEKHKELSMVESSSHNSLSDMNLTNIELENYSNVTDIQENDILELDDDRTDIYRFVPAEKVYSNQELHAMEEQKENILEPGGFKVNIIPDTNFRLPNMLKVYTQPMGDVAYFSPSQVDSAGKLGYYPLDGASILPVLALNLQPNDSVLDLCAAPGGKTLAILQTHLPGLVVCNDVSGSRMRRLRSIVDTYFPASLLHDGELILHHKDAKYMDFGIQFDKVLVDVPCLTDRHCLNKNANNIFKPGRQSERMQLTATQRDLLITGIKSCKPGGNIVYSTCTSTMPQNDGVIQAALEHIWENTQIDVVVQDTSIIRTLFEDTFKFYTKCRYGQLVLPHIQANFGPMYFCKLKRLN